MKGKLQGQDFPIIGSGSAQVPASNVIVFIVGGATYEEAKEVALTFNNSSGTDMRVILGGNTIHNSKSFMADISQI